MPLRFHSAANNPLLDLVQIERDPAESPPASGSVPAGTFSLPLAEQICTAVGHSDQFGGSSFPPFSSGDVVASRCCLLLLRLNRAYHMYSAPIVAP